MLKKTIFVQILIPISSFCNDNTTAGTGDKTRKPSNKLYIVKKIILSIIALVAIVTSSCVKEEGEGGTSIVQGKIYKVLHPNNNFTLKADTFPAAKEDVYIIYGNDAVYGDKMETSYDGTFQFRYLTKGSYRVYAFSTLPNDVKEAVIDTVTVASGKTAHTSDIYIHEGKSYNKSYIKGQVNVMYYDKGVWYPQAVYPAYDQRVYICRAGEDYQFDEVRTGPNGVFYFQNLDPGTYNIFVYSEEIKTEVLTKKTQTITVDAVGTIVTMGTAFVININV